MAGRGPGNTLQYLPPQGKLGLLPSHVTGELVSQEDRTSIIEAGGPGSGQCARPPGRPCHR